MIQLVENEKFINFSELYSLYKDFHTKSNYLIGSGDKNQNPEGSNYGKSWTDKHSKFKNGGLEWFLHNAQRLFFTKRINKMLENSVLNDEFIAASGQDIKEYYNKLATDQEKEMFLFKLYFNKDNKNCLKEFMYQDNEDARKILADYNAKINRVNEFKLPYGERQRVKAMPCDALRSNGYFMETGGADIKRTIERLVRSYLFRQFVLENKEKLQKKWDAPKTWIAKIKGSRMHQAISENHAKYESNGSGVSTVSNHVDDKDFEKEAFKEDTNFFWDQIGLTDWKGENILKKDGGALYRIDHDKESYRRVDNKEYNENYDCLLSKFDRIKKAYSYLVA